MIWNLAFGWVRAARGAALCAGLLAFHGAARAEPEWLDRADEALGWQSESGFWQADFSGLLDLEGYYTDENPAGLVFPDDEFFLNPRLSLFLDAHAGEHFYAFAQARFDRGFDPGARRDGDVRMDEYFVRYTPLKDGKINLQAGKFATVFGGWIGRHDSWDNPFINAPAPYENVLTITDQAAPPSRAGFLGRKNGPDRKEIWLPVIWGPSYASGAAVFGVIEKFSYAVEIKNASLSSRPAFWDATDLDWDYPTVSGRIGYRPTAAWNAGLSASHGAYMVPSAETTLPAGTTLGSFMQTTVGHDISYEWRKWQIAAEAMASRFEVPLAGDADTLVYYVEVKRRIMQNFFGAVRWNQQFFDTVSDGTGGEAYWDNDFWRAEVALGYRFNRHMQAKLQYGYSHQHGSVQQGEQMAAAQFTVKF